MDPWIEAAWVAAGAVVTVLLASAAVYWARNEWRGRHEPGSTPPTHPGSTAPPPTSDKDRHRQS